MTEIVTPLSNVVVAVSYDDLGGASGMVVSNLVKTTNLTVGDKLAVFNGSTYDTWVLAEATPGGAKYWAKQANTFTVGPDGQLTTGSGASAAETVKPVGTGIWLSRQNPTTSGGAPIPFYIYGKPSTTRTYTTTAGAWNLVGNPTQESVEISASVIPAGNQDAIAVPESAGLVNYTYKTGKDWRRNKDASGWGPKPVIPAGMGFWVKTANAVEIKWQ